MENLARPEVKFGEWITEGWNMFTEQWKAWVLHALVLFAIIIVPIFIWMVIYYVVVLTTLPQNPGPTTTVDPTPLIAFFVLSFGMFLVLGLAQVYFMAGMYHSAFKQLRGGRIEFRDIFSGGGSFLPIFGASILIGICMMIGVMLCVIPAFIVMGWFLFAIPLIIERRLGVMEALRVSRELTQRNLLMFILFGFVTSLIASAGSYACYVGLLVTMPLQYTIMAVAYRDCFGLPGARSFSKGGAIPSSSYAPGTPGGYGPPPTPYSPPDVYSPPPPPPPPTIMVAKPPAPEPPPTADFGDESPEAVCAKCQMKLPPTAAFCPRCGTPA